MASFYGSVNHTPALTSCQMHETLSQMALAPHEGRVYGSCLQASPRRLLKRSALN